MADEIVLCRRKDDHAQTLPIALSALPYFPDWERVPDELAGGTDAENQPRTRTPTADIAGERAPDADSDKAAKAAPKTSKGRE
ncbi:hypothetical protein [Spongiactinospora sp. TRM90649]|uniref:hypothetical protein n=1 Tax=Spongiactinospora sp. TRM90649 TaxID=3031114 RepID=UPI0023FA45FB|nr:hypothetical protein [Spongiactinospora sp. TRM90649]MDF5758617.1 hypothetical protein [Spongiactinospora sp. TRM90649]